MSASPAPRALALGARVALRRIHADDLGQIARHPFTVSITAPLTHVDELARAFGETGFWREESGAAAIVECGSARLVGSIQFYRAGPCLHGLELGYIIHNPADRGKGLAREALGLFSDHLFGVRPAHYRQQLVIEVWNTPSWRLAERCGFLREGMLRSAGLGAGDPSDCFIHARTRKDYAERRVTRIGVAS